MELLIGLIVGFVGGVLATVSLLRRAISNPNGFASFLVEISGGDPNPVK